MQPIFWPIKNEIYAICRVHPTSRRSGSNRGARNLGRQVSASERAIGRQPMHPRRQLELRDSTTEFENTRKRTGGYLTKLGKEVEE